MSLLHIDPTLLNILISVFSSFIFLFLVLFFLKPRIKIANKISKQVDLDGSIYYRIKFINKSFFPAYELKLEVRELIEEKAEPIGKNVLEENQIQLRNNSFFWIGRFIPSFLVKNYADHAIQVRIDSDLSSIVSERFKSIEMRITAKHGLSGLTGYFIKCFPTELSIEEGPYQFGNSMEILHKSIN